MTPKINFDAPDNIDHFALDREVRQMRAAEMARLGRALRIWVLNLIPGEFVIRAKAA